MAPRETEDIHFKSSNTPLDTFHLFFLMYDMDDVSLHKDDTAYFHSSVWPTVSSWPHEAGIFYPFELKLCRMAELCIPKNHMFFVSRF